MADTTVLCNLPSGLLSPVLKLAAAATPDTLANGGSGDTLVEQTNLKGWYAATVADALAGLHLATLEDAAGNVLASGYVSLADDTGVYLVVERVLLASGTNDGELDLSNGKLAWNAAWDAEVQSEAAEALALYDPPTRAELTSDVAGLQTALETIDSVVDAILLDTGAEGVVLSASAMTAMADALLDRADGVEPASGGAERTVREALRLILAACVGKLSGAASSEVSIRDTNDTKNRIVAVVDASGNRTSVILDDA